MKKNWAIFITIILVIVIILGADQAIDIGYEVSTRDYDFYRIEEIRGKWNEYSPKYNGQPYKKDPRTSYPYRAGKLEKDFIEDGVNMANFVRYLAGLPDDLEVDYVFNNQAQFGAVLLAAVKDLTHYPTKPDDMPLYFYNVGHGTTENSNIAKGIYKLSDAVVAYMMDFGDSNLENVGHRRWILNPQMKSIGFGYCNGYSTMKVKNLDRTEVFDYEYITYPTEGYFPANLFYADCCPYGSNPWSIILNPDKYDKEKTLDIRIELKDMNNSIVWNFCPKYRDSDCGMYFNIDTSNCGVPFCIIFRPDDIEDYSSGNIYRVKVTGLYTVEGEKTEIEYKVKFFDL